ncbi:MAG: hypothetical protein DRJ05_06355, partial [Bacteroidetes bacterium]
MRKHLSIFVLLFTTFSFIANINAQPLNNWLEFDGNDDYVNLGNSMDLKPWFLSVELWVYNSDWSSMPNTRFIGNTQGGGYNIGTESGNIRATINLPIWGYVSTNYSLNNLNSGWHHFAMTHNGYDLKLYVDGQFVDIYSTSQQQNIHYNDNNCTILGAEATGGCGTPSGNYFDGHIDDVRVWSMDRTQQEIFGNMNNELTGNETSLVGYWKLNEASGTSANDVAGNNDGSLVNMPTNPWVQIFTETTISLEGVRLSSVDWGDYNNDGKLDIFLTGNNGNEAIGRIYKNNGNGSFTNQSGIGVVYVDDGSVAWGDFDNDGDLDYLISGDGTTGYRLRTYRNNGDNTFVQYFNTYNGITFSSSAWGDFNNDGKLDFAISGNRGYEDYSRLFINTGYSFNSQDPDPIMDLRSGSMDWGDYDNDLDLDLLITGRNNSGDNSIIYKNNGNGNFTEQTGISLIDASHGSTVWGDYDNDGYLDILLTGSGGSIIYKNDGNGNFIEQTGISLPEMASCSVAWGDYDNDGFIDILLAGFDYYIGNISKVYKNNGPSAGLGWTFSEQTGISLPGLDQSSVAWADYDNDGDLDILLTGNTNSDEPFSKIYKNNTVSNNTAPNAPSNLSSTVSNTEVTFDWDAATDNQTPSPGLSYNIRVGTSPGGSNILDPMSNTTTGFRKVVRLGNTNQNTAWVLKNLDYGVYYWSVQSIDGAFEGSQFANEATFSVYATPDPFPGNCLEFDGTDDYVNLGNSSDLKPENTLTYELWVYNDDWSGMNYQKFICNTQGGGYTLGIESNQISAAVRLNGAYVYATKSTSGISDGWHHLAVTCDSRYVNLYVDGILESTGDAGDYYSIGYDNNNCTLLGAEVDGSCNATSGFFEGKIDEVRIWGVARIQQQIWENMHLTLQYAESNLLAYWQMNESSGSVAADNHFGIDGSLMNMADNDWVQSTVATGSGSCDTQTETNGVVTFTGTDLEMDYANHNSASVTVSKINDAPNFSPHDLTFDNQYWVVNRYGSGAFNTDLTFTLSEDLTMDDQDFPSYIELYTRNSNADGDWTLLAMATTVNASNNTATFTGIDSFSQFVIAKTPVPNINVSTDSIDFKYVIKDGQKPEPLIIDNTGHDTLIISDINIDNAMFTVDTTHFSIFPGSSFEIEVSFSPTSIGPVSGILGISCNDPFEPLVSVTLIGEGAETDNFPGTAIEFDGIDDYVDLGEPESLKLENFTLATWFKRSGNGQTVYTGTGGITAEPLITKGRGEADGDNRDMNYFLGIEPSSGVIAVDFEDMASGGNHPVYGTTIINNNEWYHAAASYNGTIWRLYLNGNLEAESVENATPRYNCIQHNAIGSALNSEGIPSGYFKGLIDEVSIWDIALDSIQVREQMHLNLSGTETGLVSYWQLNEGVDAIAHDYIPGNNGILNNMDNNDWINSTIPFGGGFASSQTEQSGTVDFVDEGLSMFYNSHNGAEITVSRIDTVPNMIPSSCASVFDSQYWAINRFGTGAFDVDLTFTVSGGITAEDESDPSIISLYTRGSTADTSWALLATASSVDAANNKATFSGVGTLGQFVIGRELVLDNFPGTALDFDGIDDYVRVSDSDLLDFGAGQDFSIEFWMKDNNSPNSFNLVSKGTGSSANGWYIRDKWNASTLMFTNNGQYLESSGAFDNEWHHVAVTADRDGDFKLYLDGELKDTKSNTLFGTFVTTTPLEFGRRSYHQDEHFTGKMDEIRIWVVNRTETEIRENMHLTLTGTEPGLVSYWQFNDSSGITLTDCLDNNNGTLMNMTEDDWVSSTIPFGGGFANSQTETSGTVDFTEEGLSMNFNSIGIAEITVSRIDTLANTNPAGTDTVFNSQYWVVNRYGSGAFDTDLTFTISEDLIAEDETTPSQIKLYTRGSTADTDWALLASATTVNAANNTANFNGITGFSQFIIAREISHDIEIDITVFLEGPYDEVLGEMLTDLNPGNIPLSQPYNVAPWNYT